MDNLMRVADDTEEYQSLCYKFGVEVRGLTGLDYDHLKELKQKELKNEH